MSSYLTTVGLASASCPPRAELLEVDRSVAVAVDREERGANLGLAIAGPEPIEQAPKLGFVDRAIPIAVDAVEAITQRIQAHRARVRCFFWQTNSALLLAGAALGACRSTPENRSNPAPPPPVTADALPFAAHGRGGSATENGPAALPPLRGEWLERLRDGEREVVVTPPLGAVAKSMLMVGVHGAGDHPDWACGGWRLASQASAFVVCPRGRKSGTLTFAWSSPEQLAEHVDGALRASLERYERYIDTSSFIFAGFSQGATLAEPFLRQNAARFPIAILAEGGYGSARSAAFANAYQAAGGQRVVLVCGTDACFRSSVRSKQVLERAGLQVLVVGDAKAGHNLNERMQKALQNAWSDITAPLVPRETSQP